MGSGVKYDYYTYHNSKTHPNKGVFESTKSTGKFAFALKIFIELKKNGHLAEGATPFMLLKYITDSDGDGRYEIDMNKACDDPKIMRESSDLYRQKKIFPEIGSTKNVTQFFADGPRTDGASGPGDKKITLPRNHSVMDAAVFFSAIYNFCSIEKFNELLEAYFSMFYVHIDKAGGQGKDGGHFGVSAAVSKYTRTTEFSATSDGRRRVDCDIFSMIGFLILSSIRDAKGQKAFDCKLIQIDRGDGSYHVVLVYTERSSGKTFMLNDGKVIPLEGDNMDESILQTAGGGQGFYEYGSVEDYQADYAGKTRGERATRTYKSVS